MPKLSSNPLGKAFRGGNKKIIPSLFDRGADPNAADNDVSEQVVICGRVGTVHMPIYHGAYINPKGTSAGCNRPRLNFLMVYTFLTENERTVRVPAPKWCRD